MRTAKITRNTAETAICLELNLDGTGAASIDTGIGFFNHMLTLLAHHSGFDLKVKVQGDLDVDFHHTVEDTGICLGEAFAKALGDKRGITRFSDTTLPMDEALVLTALDISGRSYLACELQLPSQKVGDFDTELCEEFWQAFVRASGVTLHIRQLAGRNTHHILEGVFKSAAKSLKKAVQIEAGREDQIPSTKGVL